jgi:hypothetical protein
MILSREIKRISKRSIRKWCLEKNLSLKNKIKESFFKSRISILLTWIQNQKVNKSKSDKKQNKEINWKMKLFKNKWLIPVN